MSVVTLKAAPAVEKSPIQFIGRAWKNVYQKEGPRKGTEYLNVKLDATIASVTLKPEYCIQLWPNQKREGRQDADYRLSFVEQAEKAA